MKGEQVLQKMCCKAGSYLQRHSSTILTCIGVIGVVGTSVMAVRATPKALRLINEATDEKGEKLTKLETVKVAGPAYVPSIIMGAATVSCVFGANVLNKRHQTALVSAYALVDNAYKEYRNKVKELLGEETDIQIQDAIAKDKREDIDVYVPGCGSLDCSGETVLFYESYRGKYFESTIEAVQNAEYHLNRNFTMRGCANLNEFYEFLGLSPTKEGSVLGWSSWKLLEDGCTPWIDFDHRLTTVADDGLQCYFIEMPISPELNYEEY